MMPCDRCVSRREFLGRASAGLALGVITSGCGDGIVSGVAPRPGATPAETVTIVVADFPGLATPGTLVKVSTAFAAKRTGADAFEAFSMVCTHEGCLTQIRNGERFECPCHLSRFASDGSVINGPAERPLLELATSYNPTTDVLTIN
jgi:cytochrome b6-f complex iron-sulfur subunit